MQLYNKNKGTCYRKEKSTVNSGKRVCSKFASYLLTSPSKNMSENFPDQKGIDEKWEHNERLIKLLSLQSMRMDDEQFWDNSHGEIHAPIYTRKPFSVLEPKTSSLSSTCPQLPKGESGFRFVTQSLFCSLLKFAQFRNFRR